MYCNDPYFAYGQWRTGVRLLMRITSTCKLIENDHTRLHTMSQKHANEFNTKKNIQDIYTYRA